MRVGLWLSIAAAIVGMAGCFHPRTIPAGTGPVRPPAEILVDDFETGTTQGLFAERKNRLDAFQGTFARRPSYTVITKIPDTRPGRKGNALRAEYQAGGGWCGWYTLLNGIDISRHNALTFWIKGEKGGERFDVGLTDQRMQNLEIDAVYAGPIMAFLPRGVTTEWQQVKIPLAGLRSDLLLNRMGSLVFWFRYEGKGAIQIDDIAFVYDPEVEKILEENIPRAKADPRAPRASWVWKYDPLNSLTVRQELLDFCKRTALSTLYIYLGEDPITKTSPEYQKRLGQFLKEAHARGVEVHALQGNPLWALKENHPLVLAWVKSYLDFNQVRSPAERIDGVSLDVEPYLTARWETAERENLKQEFVELVTALRKLTDSKSSKAQDERRVEGQSRPFQLGLAVPLFYEREPQFEEALVKQLDTVALMDYYDTGRDIVERARFHVELANRLGKKIVVGVETQDLVQMGQGKRRNTFHEEGWEEMERELAQVVEAFKSDPSFAGVAIHAYDSYRLLPKGRNVPTRERSGKIPMLTASRATRPITIDGNLDDWSGAAWTWLHQKQQVVYGQGAWAGPHDESCKLAFQWEPDALLAAVDVTDNVVVQQSKGTDMWEGDHVELWLDVDLYGDYNEAVNSSDDLQLGLSPGNFKEIKPEVTIWVPSVDPKSLAQVQIAAVKKEYGYTLEVRIPTSFLFQTLGKQQVSKILSSGQLQKGFRLGVMLDCSDTDEPQRPQKSMLSTSPERQWGDPTTFNILELQ